MLLACVAYQDGRKLAEIDQSEIRSYVTRPDCFVWVALQDASASELAAMQAEFGLHELAVEDARHGHQRPKIDEYGDSLFTVMHTVELAGDELGVGEVAVFAGPHYVLSVRSGSKHGLKDVRERCEREPELLKKGSGYVLYALMDAVVDRYFPVLDELETQLEAIEERIFADRSPRASLEALYDLKHKLMVLKHATAPLLEAASRLYAGRVPHVCTGLGEYFRDVCDHLVRLNQSIDTARDTIATAISVNLTMITIVDSEVTKRLAAYGALVAVPTLIAGVYGMNFVHMPELKVVLGYPISLAVMAILDGYLWYRFRKAGWL